MPKEEELPKYLYSYDSERRRRRRRKILIRRLVALAVFCAFVVTTVLVVRAIALEGGPDEVAEVTTTTEPVLGMQVGAVASTMPTAFRLVTEVFRDTVRLPTYTRPDPISFDRGKNYTDLEGIITFRGNNYRDGGSYGAVQVVSEELEMLWQVTTGSVGKSTGLGRWTGSGWTGQPLIVKWPEEVKKNMNLYMDKKIDPDLVEVIYPCLDGKIYFLDLRDGSATRPAISTDGGAIKGTASLYPNGVPLLFVGQGDALPPSQPEGVVKYRIYSLVDQKPLYTFGTNDPVAYRKAWQAYDSSALIDVETDTLIEPGENGVLYTVKLNTEWDPVTGSLSIDPESAIKFRYTAPDYGDGPEPDNSPTNRWYGMEGSASAWQNYLYVPDNGGKLMCLDLNTMEPVWVQDIMDDTNASPVFEESMADGTAYIYIGPSLHITGSGSPQTGDVYIYKINAATGEKVWTSQAYPCVSRRDMGVSGGVQGTGIVGRGDISNVVIFPVASTPSVAPGLLVALDKATGKEVWRLTMASYAWSSPVACYTDEGKSYIVICDSSGMVFLVEGATGQVVASINTLDGSVIEATPAVYGNTIVVGTRGERIDAIEIK